MRIINKPLSWYVEKIQNDDFFSMGMYGDGEWIAILKERIGKANAEHTVYTQELCDELIQSLHFKADDFLFSTPEVIRDTRASGIGEEKIDNFLEKQGLELEFYEKDMWDRETREGNLKPLIDVLKTKNVVIVSNAALRGLDFLNYDHFVEVSYPNCHKEIDRAAKECLEYGESGVYLVAMGLPAAIFVQKMHKEIPCSFFLDLGSIWDAFVGIGAQRGWRNTLYEDEKEYEKWIDKNLK